MQAVAATDVLAAVAPMTVVSLDAGGWLDSAFVVQDTGRRRAFDAVAPSPMGSVNQNVDPTPSSLSTPTSTP